MKCDKCGAELNENSKFCNNCGAQVVIEKEEKQGDSGKKKSKMILAIGIPVAVVLIVVAAVVSHVVTRNNDRATMKNGQVTLAKLQDDLNKTESKLSDSKKELDKVNEQLEAQKKEIKPIKQIYDVELAPGDYVVGEDLEPGIYHFIYKLKKDDGWSGDYIYITHKGSKGEDSTLGGTKFDTRVEASEDGEAVSVKLVAGDKVFIDGENNGNFTAAKK